MLQSHWGIRQSPYRSGFDAQYFYHGPVQEEALARLNYLVDQHHRAGLLLGEAGTGKSLLLELLAQKLRRAGSPVARVDVLGIDHHELLWQVATQWGFCPSIEEDDFRLWRRISDGLLEHKLRKLSTVLMIDDTSQASDEVAAQLQRLVHHDPAADSRLTVVLAARLERLSKIPAALLELVSLRVDLAPWDQVETSRFLSSSLAQAGRVTPIFDTAATHRLFELSGGVPRRVSQLADLALLAGAGQHLQEIDSETIEAVYYELDAVSLTE